MEIKHVNDIRRDISGPVISVIFNTQNSVTSRCRVVKSIHSIAWCRCRGMGTIYSNVSVSRQDLFAQELILTQEILKFLKHLKISFKTARNISLKPLNPAFNRNMLHSHLTQSSSHVVLRLIDVVRFQLELLDEYLKALSHFCNSTSRFNKFN